MVQFDRLVFPFKLLVEYKLWGKGEKIAIREFHRVTINGFL